MAQSVLEAIVESEWKNKQMKKYLWYTGAVLLVGVIGYGAWMYRNRG